MIEKPKKFPHWVAKILHPGSNPAPCGTPPSELDIDITLSALALAEPKHLKKRYGADGGEQQESLVRVRDACRAGDYPERLLDECPWFKEWFESGNHGNRERAGPTLTFAALSLDQQKSIAAITDLPYQVNLDDPNAVENYLKEARGRFALAAGAMALRRLAEYTAAGDPKSITETREFLYGQPRSGPMVALQQNFGSVDASPAARSSSGDPVADVIINYEKAHLEEAGEFTQFQDTLLEDDDEK